VGAASAAPAGSSASAPAGAAPSAASAAPTAAPARPVKVAYGFVSADALPLWLGEEQGIYQKYGLVPESTYLQSSAQVAPAMASGEVELALTAVFGVVEIGLAGGDQVILAAVHRYLPLRLHARPEIRRVEDLRDKRVSITRLGSGGAMATEILLERAGLLPGRDVAIIQSGTVQNQLAALTSGVVDAATVGTPATFVAEREGFPLLADGYEARIPSLHGVVAVTRPYLAREGEVVRSFLQGYIETLGVIQRDKELAKSVLARRTNTDDAEIVERTWQMYVAQMDGAPFPSTAGVQTVLDERANEVPAARTARAEDFIDEGPLRELETSGFIREHLPR
jgi:ABC-type nitrate/sulfonate/bicarbonate transport system substrate-binding protein